MLNWIKERISILNKHRNVYNVSKRKRFENLTAVISYDIAQLAVDVFTTQFL
jgi:hypothetical protein